MFANTKKEKVALCGSHQGFRETGGCWLGFVRQEGEGGKGLGARCGCHEHKELNKACTEQGECVMAEVSLGGWGGST